MKSLPFAKPLLACALAFLAGGAGCDKKANQFVPPPPPSVTVARPAERSVTDYAEFTGTTQAVESVEIRARVEGFLQSVHFEAGAVVRKGDLLFVIDPKPFQAALAEAEANLKMAETDLKLAEDKLRRNQSLFARRAISNLELIESQSERDRDAAAIEVAKAQVRKARLNLQYTEVRAPIDGRAGRNLVDVGNLVGAGEPTLLTTVVKYDPMYVYFSVSERDLLAYQKKRETSKSSEDTDTFEMGLADDSGYPHAGRLDFLENQLDPDTGTILVRGVFPNPDKKVFPGLFARVRVPVDVKEDALLVPEEALGMDQRGRFLLTVNDENVVEYRSVETGALLDGMRVVLQGISASDRVVVNGLQRARPGAKVSPAEASGKESAKPVPQTK